MAFSKHMIDRLLAHADIVTVAHHYLQQNLHRTGKREKKEYRALCPFHSEKTPSFSVTGIKQFYHCFGCGAHGNAIELVMNMEHLEFVDAVLRLAEIVDFRVPSDKTNVARARRRTRAKQKTVYSWTHTYVQNLLYEDFVPYEDNIPF